MGSIKQINIKNRTYYFFNDMINIKFFDSNLSKIDIDFYYIGYITMKDHLNIHSVNPLHFGINKTDRYIEESNGNKYLALVSTNKNKETLKSMQSYGIKLKF